MRELSLQYFQEKKTSQKDGQYFDNGKIKESAKEIDRMYGCFFGNILGDALGAPFEFSPVQYNRENCTILDFSDPTIWSSRRGKTIKPGQWTDDTAMMLCLSDSLLIHNKLKPTDLRLRFLNWWHFGYCNAFGYDEDRDDKQSIGLGSIVSASLDEFQKSKSKYTTYMDTARSSGNGSIVRCGCIPLFCQTPKEAERLAYQQSKTTHTGEEAAECCRLLVHLMLQGVSGDGSVATALQRTQAAFSSPLYSIQCLLHSKQEEHHQDNQGLALEDRNWDWKAPHFRYAPGRVAQNKTYIGSYAMDAMAMCLHCVFHSDSFEGALVKAANLCGDADSVCAVVGQVAGSIYGLSEIKEEWLEAVFRWDPKGDLLLRAYKLIHQMK
uniref:ADP-ribosylhydrolase ARH3 n=1 Tax=Arcella intermedia TaxID=1963864 RepID=A0A6B2L4V5_9EUKA